jgi:hypothetical protein
LVDKRIIKLSKLCEHWANHNDSHKESFQKWRDIAQELELQSVVENLNKAIKMMENCNRYLIEAKNKLSLE